MLKSSNLRVFSHTAIHIDSDNSYFGKDEIDAIERDRAVRCDEWITDPFHSIRIKIAACTHIPKHG